MAVIIQKHTAITIGLSAYVKIASAPSQLVIGDELNIGKSSYS